ncbi:MAG: putative Subtilisin, partial [Promethearchaeota archaeon]
MKKSKIFGYILVLVLLMSSNFVIPFLGMNGIYGNETNFSTDTEHRFNTKQVEDSLPQSNSNKKNDKQLILDKKTSVFGQDLENYIAELSMQSKPISGQMKFIMMFREGIEKQTRLNYLDSIFTNYKLIYNYDVFSGVYVQLDLYELVENYDTLKNEGLISKIYKSKTFQTPIFGDNYLAAQPLNESAYENWWLPAIGADNLEYDGSGVRVAVVDSGIYDAHPDLDLTLDFDFVANDSVGEDNNGHGTHVAGIIASSGASSGGKYVGVAPGVELINAKAGNSTGSLESGNIINAIEWSAKPVADGGAGADIISMSFGGGFPIAHEPLSAAITAISREYDVIMVASAGNSGPDYFTGSSPASGVSIISVGATDKNNNLASFSSWGPTFTYLGYPDVAAPGVNIFSTLSKDSIIAKQELFVGDYADYADNGDYMPLSGTSMACPMVSGALALILSAYPEISVETARIALMEGANKLPENDDDDTVRSGIGLINVKASLEFLEEKTDTDDVAKVFPDSLPIKPNTLLNFPGDKQLFNLSIFTGKKSLSFDLDWSAPAGIDIKTITSDLSTT